MPNFSLKRGKITVVLDQTEQNAVSRTREIAAALQQVIPDPADVAVCQAAYAALGDMHIMLDKYVNHEHQKKPVKKS